jgi:hypothetical protein
MLAVSVLPALAAYSGLAIGVTMSLGLVYVFERLAGMSPVNSRKLRGREEYRETPNYRYWIALVAGVVLMVCEPFLLGPYVQTTLTGASLREVLGTWFAVWSWFRVFAGVLALIALAVTAGAPILQVESAKETAAPAKEPAQVAPGVVAVAPEPVQPVQSAVAVATAPAQVAPGAIADVPLPAQAPEAVAPTEHDAHAGMTLCDVPGCGMWYRSKGAHWKARHTPVPADSVFAPKAA